MKMIVVTWIVLTLLAVPSWLRSTTLTLSNSSVLASLLLTTWSYLLKFMINIYANVCIIVYYLILL